MKISLIRLRESVRKAKKITSKMNALVRKIKDTLPN